MASKWPDMVWETSKWPKPVVFFVADAKLEPAEPHVVSGRMLGFNALQTSASSSRMSYNQYQAKGSRAILRVDVVLYSV